MDSLTRFFRKLRILTRRESFGAELEEEMAFHREQKEREFRAAGMSERAARYTAMREFGNEGLQRERSREVTGFRLETVLQDARFSVRQLRRNPGFAFTATLMLALGIGASVALFAFVDAALIKPLPYAEPARLVDVAERAQLFPRSNLSYPDYLDWKRDNNVLSSLEVYTGTGYLLNTPTGTEPVPAARVSDGFFRTLGVVPILGRDFYAGEDLASAAKTVMLNYSTWQRRFGGRKDVIGETVLLSGVPNTIVGVLPPDFHFALRGSAEFWVTLHASSECDLRRGCHSLYGVGRLKDGVTVKAAQAEMQAIAERLEKQYPSSNRDQGANVRPLAEVIVGNVRPILLALLSGAGLLLLIACVNVSSLLLVRSESRKREMAVKGALGASPARLVRQFLTESLVMTATGSLLGLALAYGVIQALVRLISKDMMAGMPYLRGLGLNGRVIAFAAGVSLLAAILFSLTPILRLSPSAMGTEMRAGLAEGSRGSAGTLWRRFGANLVVLELAIAMVLLVGAGLLGKSFYRMLHVELGFQPDHLATLQVALSDTTYSKDSLVAAAQQEILRRLLTVPGVVSAGAGSLLPLEGNGNTDWIRFERRPYDGKHIEVNQREVSSGYLSTLKAKLSVGAISPKSRTGRSPWSR